MALAPLSELGKVLMDRQGDQAQQPSFRPSIQTAMSSLFGRGPAPDRPTGASEQAISKTPGQAIGEMTGGKTRGGFQLGLSPPIWPAPAKMASPMDLPRFMPTASAKVPPRWERFQTAEKMQDAYRNDWSPNPMLIRILEGRMS